MPLFTVEDGKKAIDDKRMAVSLAPLPVITAPPDVAYFGIKFALADGTYSTVLLDQTLWSILSAFGKKLDDAGWEQTGQP